MQLNQQYVIDTVNELISNYELSLKYN